MTAGRVTKRMTGAGVTLNNGVCVTATCELEIEV